MGPFCPEPPPLQYFTPQVSATLGLLNPNFCLFVLAWPLRSFRVQLFDWLEKLSQGAELGGCRAHPPRENLRSLGDHGLAPPQVPCLKTVASCISQFLLSVIFTGLFQQIFLRGRKLKLPIPPEVIPDRLSPPRLPRRRPAPRTSVASQLRDAQLVNPELSSFLACRGHQTRPATPSSLVCVLDSAPRTHCLSFLPSFPCLPFSASFTGSSSSEFWVSE